MRSVSEFSRQTHGASENWRPRFAVLTKPRFSAFSRRTMSACARSQSVVAASLASLMTTTRAHGGAEVDEKLLVSQLGVRDTRDATD